MRRSAENRKRANPPRHFVGTRGPYEPLDLRVQRTRLHRNLVSLACDYAGALFVSPRLTIIPVGTCSAGTASRAQSGRRVGSVDTDDIRGAEGAERREDARRAHRGRGQLWASTHARSHRPPRRDDPFRALTAETFSIRLPHSTASASQFRVPGQSLIRSHCAISLLVKHHGECQHFGYEKKRRPRRTDFLRAAGGRYPDFRLPTCMGTSQFPR